MSRFTSQPFNGPNTLVPHPTPEEAPNLFEYGSEDLSDLDDPESDDDLSPILSALAVSSIKITLASVTN